MKILLLSPPTKGSTYPPLGLAYIAAVLNKDGTHQAIIKDGHNSSIKELVNITKKINPEIVGISMGTSNRFICLELAKQIKLNCKVPIVVGGPHPTLMPEQLLKNYSFIDYIIRNEGEYACLNLLNALESNSDLKKVKGLSYRKGSLIVHNENSEFIKNLDALPFPEYKFFNLKEYDKSPEFPKDLGDYTTGSIITSRGCPYKCTFCSSSNFWGYKIRYRKPKLVVDEIENLYNKYNTRYLVFNDDNFTTDTKRAIEICKLMIERGLHKKVRWNCRSEVNIINRELLKWLKMANCHLIEYGIEDASPEGLKFFKKAHTMEQAYRAFDLSHEFGFDTRTYIIIGGDHESLKNIELKKKAIARMNPHVTSASLLLAYPGTEIYENGKKKGWWDDSIWLKPCVGKNFHNFVPIYPSNNLNLNQLFSASADIEYWWNTKKGTFGLNKKIGTVVDLIKRKDFSKIYSMGKAVIFRSIKGNG